MSPKDTPVTTKDSKDNEKEKEKEPKPKDNGNRESDKVREVTKTKKSARTSDSKLKPTDGVETETVQQSTSGEVTRMELTGLAGYDENEARIRENDIRCCRCCIIFTVAFILISILTLTVVLSFVFGVQPRSKEKKKENEQGQGHEHE